MRVIKSKKTKAINNAYHGGKIHKKSLIPISRPSMSAKLPLKEVIAVTQMVTRSQAKLLNTFKDGVQLIQFHTLKTNNRKKRNRLSMNKILPKDKQKMHNIDSPFVSKASNNNISTIVETSYKKSSPRDSIDVTSIPVSRTGLVLTSNNQINTEVQNENCGENNFEDTSSPKQFSPIANCEKNSTFIIPRSSFNTDIGKATIQTINETIGINITVNTHENANNYREKSINTPDQTVLQLKGLETAKGNIPNASSFDNNISDMVKHEIWKKEQLYNLQRNIVTMEGQKLSTLKSIFSALYENLFRKNRTGN